MSKATKDEWDKILKEHPTAEKVWFTVKKGQRVMNVQLRGSIKEVNIKGKIINYDD